MTSSRRGHSTRNRHGTGSRRSQDDIKEILRTSLQNVDPKNISQNAVRDACIEAGLDDATAARLNDMALYAAYAVDSSVRRSGQSAFTWIPLQGVTQEALESAPEGDVKRAGFTKTFINALTGMLKYLEEQDSLDNIEGPPDLSEGSKIIHNLMASINKVLRLAISGSSDGRAKSLRLTADAVTKTVETMQLSTEADSQEVEKPYKRLVAELAVAKKLESRASQELSAAKPGDELSPSLKAAVEAVYAYQGPEIQRDVAELQRGILDAQKVLVSATEHLQKADVDMKQFAVAPEQTGRERSSRRGVDFRHRGRRSDVKAEECNANEDHNAEDEVSLDATEDADVGGLEDSEATGEQLQEGRHASGRRRPRKSRRDRDRRRGRRGGQGDGTQRREEATDIEEEAGEEEEGEIPAAGRPAKTGMPAAAASPRSSLAEPPGFSPMRASKAAEVDEAQEHGGQAKRSKKRSGRREKERQARRANAAAREQEANCGPSDAAFGDGFGGAHSKQVWAEDEYPEESKPQRARRERGGRRRRGAENVAPESADPTSESAPNTQAKNQSNHVQAGANQDSSTLQGPSSTQAKSDMQRAAPERRSKYKEMSQALIAIRADLYDPLSEAPLTDPVVAADGYTYERSAIQRHLAGSRISPVSGQPMGSTLYDNRLASSLIATLAALPHLGAT